MVVVEDLNVELLFYFTNLQCDCEKYKDQAKKVQLFNSGGFARNMCYVCKIVNYVGAT